jgi:chitin disaccharide deacetylase
MKRLIINADDFGYDADTFAATSSLLLQGIVRSATILLGFPESEAAMRFALNNRAECSFGLHFNIAEGKPLASGPASSLVNSSGTFRGAIAQRLMALSGSLNPKDIAEEATAQFSMLADFGITPTHLDSHGHFHKFPAVHRALQPVMKRFDVQWMRRASTSHDNPRIYSDWLDRYCNRSFDKYCQGPDYFFNTRSDQPDWLKSALSSFQTGVTEIGIHPGNAEEWRRKEMVQFILPDLKQWLIDQNILISSYLDLNDVD